MQLRRILIACALASACLAGASAQLAKPDGTIGIANLPPDCDNATTSKLLYDATTAMYSCGTDQSGGSSSDILLRLATAIATGANTTPVALTGMTFTAAAATTYEVAIFGAVSAAAATTGYGFGVDCAQTPVMIALTGSSQLANTGTSSQWSAIADNAIVGVTSGIPSASTIAPTHGGGVIRSHATTAGTCQFIFRSETTAVITAQAETVITIRVIP